MRGGGRGVWASFPPQFLFRGGGATHLHASVRLRLARAFAPKTLWSAAALSEEPSNGLELLAALSCAHDGARARGDTPRVTDEFASLVTRGECPGLSEHLTALVARRERSSLAEHLAPFFAASDRDCAPDHLAPGRTRHETDTSDERAKHG